LSYPNARFSRRKCVNKPAASPPQISARDNLSHLIKGPQKF
jgi:hypothetical protein